MDWLAVASMLGSALIPILPQLVSAIPSPYRDIATGMLALVTIVYHRYQPAPTQAAKAAAEAAASPVALVKP